MKNITLSLPDELYEKVKAAAHEKEQSINAFVRETLDSKLVLSQEEWVRKYGDTVREFKVSYGKKISRDEIYEDRLGLS